MRGRGRGGGREGGGGREVERERERGREREREYKHFTSPYRHNIYEYVSHMYMWATIVLKL